MFTPEDSDAVVDTVTALVAEQGAPVSAWDIAVAFNQFLPDGSIDLESASAFLDDLTDKGRLDRPTVFSGDTEHVGYAPKGHEIV